jgi:3-oxoadipate enol-lactonase
VIEFSYRGSDGWPLYAAAVGPADDLAEIRQGPALILLHGGGPDHHSLVPLAQRLADRCTVVLPDVRGYGRSVCADASRHTWAQYADDVVSLLNHVGMRRAVVGGAGLGATISLRTALAYPDRVDALVLISVEDIEDDAAKAVEIAFMEAFAARVRDESIEAAWQPILKDLPPVIATMVRDAIPRSDPASIAAAAAIGYDRSFRSVEELSAINVPALVIPGIDWRHPKDLAERVVRVLPKGRLSPIEMSTDLYTADDFARAFAPAIRGFLGTVVDT